MTRYAENAGLRTVSTRDAARGSTERSNQPRMHSWDGSHAPLGILAVEDHPADLYLLREALTASPVRYTLHAAADGQAALDFLRDESQPTPHLILLDLNLPGKSGHDVLAEIKQDAVLRRIPVVVLSSSAAAHDVGRAYDLHANCYIQKPTDLDAFFTVMRVIEDFWMRLVQLPIEPAAGPIRP